MATAKQTMAEIIALQPDDHSYEQILREMVYGEIVQRALAEADAGRVHTNFEVQARIESWR